MDLEQPARVIAAHLAEWGEPHVERAIFLDPAPAAIAQLTDAFCRQHLGAGIERSEFYQSSIGSVHGLRLTDGRRVVLKAHQPGRSAEFLAEVLRVQRHLVEAGFPAPRPLIGPVPFGRGLAIVEELLERGERGGARRPESRRALASSLHEIVALCRPLVDGTRLLAHLHSNLPSGRLWPTPHSKLFDFEATAAGAEWIDALAAEARGLLVTPAGEKIIGHCDWRMEHVRFEGTRVVAAYDWDSLCHEHETVLLGSVAHGFTADWTLDDPRQAPSLDEARAFVADYEDARGRAFTPAERKGVSAAFTYAVAYTARCGHALDPLSAEVEEGTFRALARTMARMGPGVAGTVL
jgi:hypothetical protein